MYIDGMLIAFGIMIIVAFIAVNVETYRDWKRRARQDDELKAVLNWKPQDERGDDRKQAK